MRLTRYISVRFIGMAALLVALSIPIFYLVIEKIMEKNVDESLFYQKQWVISRLQQENPENFPRFNRNVAVREVQDILRTDDELNTRNIYLPNLDEFVNHRVLDFYKEINGKKYHFKIRKSLVENEDILETVAMLQGILFITLLLVLLFINRNVEQKIWIPFYKMLESLKRYRIDHHNFEPQPQSPVSEMNALNTSLLDLTERNRKLFSAQKEFTENASHELQTPLAVMRNKLEMLMQTAPLTDQQTQYIADLYAANQKITKLNKSLLLLAKIENHQFDGVQEIPLSGFVENAADNLKFVAEEKNITFDTLLNSQKQISANENLLSVLINNLISNALKYTERDGKIQLKIVDNTFEVTNSSENGKLDEENLFKRFQRQNNGGESTGLGLEICKKICEMYGWQLNYRFSGNQHIFSVLFN